MHINIVDTYYISHNATQPHISYSVAENLVLERSIDTVHDWKCLCHETPNFALLIGFNSPVFNP